MQDGGEVRELVLRLLSVVVLVCCPAAAAAQTAPSIRIVQTVVVTATAAPAPPESVGKTVFTITGADLAALGISTIAEALRLAPGVDVRARGPLDVQSDFALRGATFGQNLVLVDGRRINDSQSGHHNGDFPTAVLAVDRIEIVTGAGSAVHGADALGGTINVLTRSDAHAAGRFAAGQHGLATAQFSAQGGRLPARLAVSAWGSRSSGFQAGREFAIAGAAVRTVLGRGWRGDLRHVTRKFGAAGFYGPSPSKEWTDHTMASADWTGVTPGWTTVARVTARNHGDHFLWDGNRPGFAENFHRTNAIDTDVRVVRDLTGGSRLTFGAGGGADWVNSTNLGRRGDGRAHVLAEAQHAPAARAVLTTGVRLDAYSTFGPSVNPTLAVVVQASSAIRLRGSVGRAFRVPTYTERFYRDPANAGTADLRAEHGWSLDGGVDLLADGWTATVSPYHRRDANVIDWVRSSPSDIWRSSNVRDVTSSGIEVSLSRRWREGFIRGHVSVLDVDAPALALLSKYVLEFARRSVGVAASTPLAAGIRLGLTADYRHRADGQRYTLVGAKVSRTLAQAEIFVEVTNALNETYREIAGVAMPGRWAVVGIRVGK